jgi:hypothetical protein
VYKKKEKVVFIQNENCNSINNQVKRNYRMALKIGGAREEDVNNYLDYTYLDNKRLDFL